MKRVLNHIYEIIFVPADFTTARPHEFIDDPVKIAVYQKKITEQGGEGFDPALRPKLVIIDHGPWTRKPRKP